MYIHLYACIVLVLLLLGCLLVFKQMVRNRAKIRRGKNMFL